MAFLDRYAVEFCGEYVSPYAGFEKFSMSTNFGLCRASQWSSTLYTLHRHRWCHESAGDEGTLPSGAE